MLDHLILCHAVVAALTEQGAPATVEYPGLVVFTDRNGRAWATGLNGWDYATDLEGFGNGALDIDVTDDERDPEAIAAAIGRALDTLPTTTTED